METFFSSDLHLSHARICELAYRPWTTVEEMNEGIIDRWNEVVGVDDEVYLLGDAVMGHRMETLPLLARLNGTTRLLAGNHDYCHPMNPKAERWVSEYEKYVEIMPIQMIYKMGNMDVLLSHFPRGDIDHTEEVRYEEWRPTDMDLPILHGHTHGSEGRLHDGNQVDVGIDAWEFYPVSVDTLIGLLS